MIKIDGRQWNSAELLFVMNIAGIVSLFAFLIINFLFLLGTIAAVLIMVLLVPFVILDDIVRWVSKKFKK